MSSVKAKAPVTAGASAGMPVRYAIEVETDKEFVFETEDFSRSKQEPRVVAYSFFRVRDGTATSAYTSQAVLIPLEDALKLSGRDDAAAADECGKMPLGALKYATGKGAVAEAAARLYLSVFEAIAAIEYEWPKLLKAHAIKSVVATLRNKYHYLIHGCDCKDLVAAQEAKKCKIYETDHSVKFPPPKPRAAASAGKKRARGDASDSGGEDASAADDETPKAKAKPKAKPKAKAKAAKEEEDEEEDAAPEPAPKKAKTASTAEAKGKGKGKGKTGKAAAAKPKSNGAHAQEAGGDDEIDVDAMLNAVSAKAADAEKKLAAQKKEFPAAAAKPKAAAKKSA